MNAHSPSSNSNAHPAFGSTAAAPALKSHRKIYSPVNATEKLDSAMPAQSAAASQNFAVPLSPLMPPRVIPCGSSGRNHSRKNASRDAREPEIAVLDDMTRRSSSPHTLSIDKYLGSRGSGPSHAAAGIHLAATAASSYGNENPRRTSIRSAQESFGSTKKTCC